MNAQVLVRRVGDWIAPLLVCLTAMISVAAADRPAGSPLSAPQAEPRFRAGDQPLVAADNARLMLGQTVLAEVPKGQRIVVVEVRDDWIGTQLIVNGQKKAGWIRAADFIPTGRPGAEGMGIPTLAGGSQPAGRQVYTVLRPVAEEAVTPSPARRLPTRAAESPAWDAFLIGKYLRHETDPNIHVWEPWRNR